MTLDAMVGLIILFQVAPFDVIDVLTTVTDSPITLPDVLTRVPPDLYKVPVIIPVELIMTLLEVGDRLSKVDVAVVVKFITEVPCNVITPARCVKFPVINKLSPFPADVLFIEIVFVVLGAF
jgi:hypothetical protein